MVEKITDKKTNYPSMFGVLFAAILLFTAGCVAYWVIVHQTGHGELFWKLSGVAALTAIGGAFGGLALRKPISASMRAYRSLSGERR
ncbi:hypothetical protein A5784_29220 [Mycobacterium sp. 852013-50091_SCH5140682]|jgi:hypothetical protein|uniref:Uncharacterized protein n=2 Tax=Mycobacteriaceae TaxID=1762 RepID=A0A1W9ZUK6_9MYCO|nr:hypothetical protein A5784_29220 [Mycobacterium sp. 852013-50091_SCH5140682]ORA21345.1 hypothetical protein BST13_37740 [Mycobacterium aquaticum]